VGAALASHGRSHSFEIGHSHGRNVITKLETVARSGGCRRNVQFCDNYVEATLRGINRMSMAGLLM
jgi:hypothetical protein